MNNSPIGIFDSGVGGTSIWKEIAALMPYEDSIYLADSKNAPYGEKSRENILQLSIKNTEFLVDHGCKIIVVACNTATTNAIQHLRKHFQVPFIGIEPAIKPAALQSRSKTVGVLATKGTLASDLFHSTAKNHAEGIVIVEQEGTGLVPLIEAGKEGAPETRMVLRHLLQPMLDKGIDYLVLGCTHYPYLIPMLKELLPPHVMIIDSGVAVARQTFSILQQANLLSARDTRGKHQFYTNTNTEVLNHFLKEVEFQVDVAYLDF